MNKISKNKHNHLIMVMLILFILICVCLLCSSCVTLQTPHPYELPELQNWY